jgi:hypothetical protein
MIIPSSNARTHSEEFKLRQIDATSEKANKVNIPKKKLNETTIASIF